MFDGEELLEEDKNKEEVDDSPEKEKTEDSPDKEKTEDIDIEAQVENNKDYKVQQVEDEDIIAMLASMETPEPVEAFMNDGENQAVSTEAVQIHTKSDYSCDKNSLQKSNTELVTSSPTHSPVETAVVVDLHSTKVDTSEPPFSGHLKHHNNVLFSKL